MVIERQWVVDHRRNSFPADVEMDDPPHNALVRERLLEIGRRAPIMAVEAPSGFGKTVLAELWLARSAAAGRTAWISLDVASRDPTVFLARLVRAIKGSLDDFPEGAALENASVRAAFVASLADALPRHGERAHLVLDDAHVLAGSSSENDLRHLLALAGDVLRICVTFQPGSLDVGLARMASRARVAWIHREDLAFTSDELGQLAHLKGRHPSSPQVAWLWRATEGWPALVQLALAVPLPAWPPSGDELVGLGPVSDFIHECFLGELTREERDVLWVMTCLGQAPAALLESCGLPAGTVGAALQRFTAMGLLRRDATLGVVLHPLVRDAASRLLGLDMRATRASIVQRAAHWHWREGQGPEAVRRLLDPACDLAAQARTWLVDIGHDLVFRQARLQTLLDLVAEWERLTGEHDPLLDAMAAWALILQRRFSSAEERIDRHAAPPGGQDIHLLQRAVLAGHQDKLVTAGQLVRDWIRRNAGSRTSDMGTAQCVLAFSLKSSGQVEEANQALIEAHACFETTSSGYAAGWAHVVGTLIHIRAGSYRAAIAEVDLGLRRCPGAHGFSSLRAMLFAVSAFLRYERDELAEVRDVLDEALPLLLEQGAVDCIILGYTAAARLRSAAGDFGAALDILAEGEAAGMQRGLARLMVSLRAERGLLLLRSGATREARALAQMPDAFASREECGRLVEDRTGRLLARLAMADGDAQAAQTSLAWLIPRARAVRSRNKLCELLLLRACAHDLLGQKQQTHEALTEALEIGAAEGYVRTFLDDRATMDPLLRRWLDATLEADSAAARLAGTLLQTGARPRVLAARPAPALDLKRREMQILRLVDDGLSNALIAQRCCLSEGTVKWYLHNLYEKLDVSGRTALLRAARTQRLLP